MWRFLTFVVVTGLSILFYVSAKYHTSRPCQALAQVIVEEAPGAVDRLTQERFGVRFGAGRLARRYLDPRDETVRRLAHDFMFSESNALDPAECAGVVVAADVNRDWFQKKLSERIAAEMDARL